MYKNIGFILPQNKKYTHFQLTAAYSQNTHYQIRVRNEINAILLYRARRKYANGALFQRKNNTLFYMYPAQVVNRPASHTG